MEGQDDESQYHGREGYLFVVGGEYFGEFGDVSGYVDFEEGVRGVWVCYCQSKVSLAGVGGREMSSVISKNDFAQYFYCNIAIAIFCHCNTEGPR